MKFGAFKEFKNLNFQGIADIVKYLTVDLTKTLRELYTGLQFLKLTENFNAFKITVVIPATSELRIRNELRGRIPTERLIVRSDSGDVMDGDTPWSIDYVYLKNTGGTPASVTVVFLE